MNFSKHALDVMEEREISKDWVVNTLTNPSRIDRITRTEYHYFAHIPENGNRCLKVVFNPVTETVITTYFDRNMKKRGCR